MRLCSIRDGALEGSVDFEYNDSYNVRIYLQSRDENDELTGCRLLLYRSFGNGVAAEDYLLEKMEYPAWTLLETM